jgi:hypothetical protein
MMDQERTEKELQEVFVEVQRSYKTLLESAFALQKQTLETAQSLFEGSVEANARNTRATLASLADQARSQQEALETLLQKSTEAFRKVMEAPYDHQRKVEEAKAQLEEAKAELEEVSPS